MIKWNILKVELFLIPDHHMSPVQVYVLDLSLVKVAFWAESPDWVDYMRRFYASRHNLGQQRLSKEEIIPVYNREMDEAFTCCFL